MISRCNIKRTTGSGRAFYTFLCLGLVTLIFIGDAPAQTRKTGSPEEGASQTQKKFPNLFSALKMRSKTETVKAETLNEAGTKTPSKEERAENIDKTETKNAEKRSADAKVEEQNKNTAAPLPPEIDYFEKNRQSAGNTIPVAETSPTREANRVPPVAAPERQIPIRQEEQTIASLSSYSFDSRDWVEHFPVEHYPIEKPDGEDRFSTNQTTMLSETKTRSAPPPSARIVEIPRNSFADDDFSNEWNGAATSLKPEEDRNLKFASANRSITGIMKDFDRVPAGIDLTPSYISRLKYSEVCGVVVVQSNFPLAEVRPILDEIKLLQRDLNLYMGVPAPKEKIELCLFRDEASYTRFLREVFPKAPRDRRALYIKLDNKPGTLLVQRTEEFEIDLRHEMTHAIIHASIRDVPIWLDEGLAKYFEVPVQNRAAKNPYMKPIRRNANFGGVPILGRLEKLEHIGHMGAREYRDSWAWVHFMIHYSPQTHRLLAGYLQMLATLPQTTDSQDRSMVRIPPLGPYLQDILENPRDCYREHFQSWNDE